MRLATALAGAIALSGCATVKNPAASGAEKQSFLYAAAEEQAVTGPKDCRRYVEGLSGRLLHSSYHYDVQPLYFCSIGAECHVVLRVGAGEGQFVADNGAFIEGHVEPLLEFERRVAGHGSWRQVSTRDARLLMMSERYGHLS